MILAQNKTEKTFYWQINSYLFPFQSTSQLTDAALLISFAAALGY